MKAPKEASQSLILACDRRLTDIGVRSEAQRVEFVRILIGSGAPMLRQRKPGTKRKYRSMMLYPNQGWTLDAVRRMLCKPW